MRGDYMETKTKIKINLPVLLAQKRMSQKDLAEKTEIRTATINALYNEKAVEVRFKHLLLICEVLQCNINDLLEIIPDNKESQ
jgi:putative transcriptional regulator